MPLVSHAAGYPFAYNEAQTRAWIALPVDRPKYRQRNVIEGMFASLKEKRRIVTRFDKLEKIYGAMVSLACITPRLHAYC